MTDVLSRGEMRRRVVVCARATKVMTGGAWVSSPVNVSANVANERLKPLRPVKPTAMPKTDVYERRAVNTRTASQPAKRRAMTMLKRVLIIPARAIQTIRGDKFTAACAAQSLDQDAEHFAVVI